MVMASEYLDTMQTTSQSRPHTDRNVVPPETESDTSASECPVDPGNFAHMRADRSVLDD
jgi:hypothetical protein